ncbi:non-specific lipid transfer protein GPI-anchored 5-like [Diospyros lotus]|uniref:non-specific lipid transfer protein GPI-anchored 5-like n=1 Tax=Diospyros lotus TaxID=55363 RepID=UPI0022563BC8|nr:non-specific lipid transfer protein GPI-anchored 5-like [Diospyros lotus]
MAAGQRFEMGLALAVMTVLLAGAGVAAQQSSSGCSNVLISLSPCLNYITGNSSTPSSGCCSQLGSVVRSQPQCLCEVLNGGGSSLGIEVNQTQAVALPGACNVQTPPVSRCNAAASPAGSPSETPEPDTDPSSGAGSKTVPSTDASSAAEMTIPLIFSLLFIASYSSTLTIY